jgi:DNA-binding transcriptional LysR family regulator
MLSPIHNLLSLIDKDYIIFVLDEWNRESGIEIMNLFQLEYFVTVAEELHFARAAERLHVAQPSLSFQIKQLEEEIGVRLFQRTTRRVELTAAGVAFLEKTRLSLRTLRDGVDAAQRIERGEQGTITLGYNGYTLYNLIPQLLQSYRVRHPQVQVRVREVYEPYSEQQLLSGELDVVLGIIEAYDSSEHPAYDEMNHTDLVRLPLFKEPLTVALPRDNPLCSQQSLRLAMLADQDFIVMDRVLKPNVYAQTIYFCHTWGGFSPKIAQEAFSIEAIIGLVASGTGIALATQSIRELRTDKVVYLPLIEPTIEVIYGLVWNRQNESPLLRSLVMTAEQLDIRNVGA